MISAIIFIIKVVFLCSYEVEKLIKIIGLEMNNINKIGFRNYDFLLSFSYLISESNSMLLLAASPPWRENWTMQFFLSLQNNSDLK